MKKLIGIIAITIFLSGLANAAGFMVELKAQYFTPSEKAFKDVYGSQMTFGGEIGIHLGKGISIWAGGDYFSRKGKLSFTEEETKMQIIPLYVGIKYRFSAGKINPYLGLGIGYFQYKESNPIGKIEEGDMGYIGEVGCLFKIKGGLFFDIKGSYSYCKVKPAEIKAALGGLKAGIGLGFEF